MILEVLVEEPSARAAVEILLPRIAPDVPCYVHEHEGKHDLLRKLPGRLAGYAHFPGALVVVLVDRAAGIPQRVLARIAVEELEAWLLGDVAALAAAFPGVPTTLGKRARFRDPDAVSGGTAEALFQVLTEAGHATTSKVEVARRVASHMNVEENRSGSFRVFRDGVRACCGAA